MLENGGYSKLIRLSVARKLSWQVDSYPPTNSVKPSRSYGDAVQKQRVNYDAHHRPESKDCLLSDTWGFTCRFLCTQ
jgi:hypothetical protein